MFYKWRYKPDNFDVDNIVVHLSHFKQSFLAQRSRPGRKLSVTVSFIPQQA